MSGSFHENYREEKHELPSDRSTGFVFAAVAAIVAVLYRHNPTVLSSAAIVSSLFVLVSVLAPGLLRPLNVVWMKFALLLSKVMNPIVMGILFVVAIVPAGLIMQRFADPLRKKRLPGSGSYWVPRQTQPGSMRNQF
jgi:hypothetical protein